jgi:predicted transcriptional regulator
MAAMKVRPLDTLLAIKMLGLIPALNANDRRVAVAIVEHFDRKKGRCDPGMKRIASLLGISTRTVIRSVQKLHRLGLIRRVRHGGRYNQNAYEPAWSRFQEDEKQWRTKFREDSNRRKAKELSLTSCQQSQLPGDKVVEQTCSTNLSELTYVGGHPNKQLKRERNERDSIPTRMTPRDAARDAAERRWMQQLNERFSRTPITYGEIIQAVTDEIRAEATEHELHRPGTGLRWVVARLKLQ